MIEETIRQIEERLRASENLAAETRTELLTLLAKVRAEASHLPQDKILPEPPGDATEDKSIQDDVEKLRGTLEEFEESHPKVVHLVNHLANTLAGLGI
jgi:hypothetical protein